MRDLCVLVLGWGELWKFLGVNLNVEIFGILSPDRRRAFSSGFVKPLSGRENASVLRDAFSLGVLVLVTRHS